MATGDKKQGSAGPAKKAPGKPVVAARAIAILLFLIISVLAAWQGKMYGVISWFLLAILLLDTSVNVLYGFFEEPGARGMGLRYWLANIFLGTPGTRIVSPSGKITPTKPPGPIASTFAKLGALGQVVIENGAAVVFERGGKLTRVHGPGIVWVKRQEQIARIIDLRRQVRSRPVRKIMTRDGLCFNLSSLDGIFEISADFDPQRGEYSFSEEAVLDLVYRGGFMYLSGGQPIEWGERVMGSVEYHLRNIASTYDLEEVARLENGSARERFMNEIEARAIPAVRQYGVNLLGIDMGNVELPDDLQKYLSGELKKQVKLQWAEAQGEAIRRVADGLNQAIMTIKKNAAEGAGESKPLLLVNLVDMLERIWQDSLQLESPFHTGTPRALPSGSKRGEEE